MKEITGYVRSIPGGTGIANVPVSIRLKKGGTLVPVGGMIGASANPVTTDADGRFTWSCELSPGPLKVEAAIDAGAELKVRVGDEVMQAGDIFISDIPFLGRMFTNGVIDGVGSNMAVSAVTGALQVTVGTGAMNILGRILQLESTRTITIDANPTLASRIDVVYAVQYTSGVDRGMQDIRVVKGTSSGVVPAIPTIANASTIGIARVTIPQGATSVTVAQVAPLASPSNVALDAGQVNLTHLASDVTSKLTDAMFTVTSPTTGQHLAYDGSKWVNEDNLISAAEDAAIASPVAGQVLTYNSGKWKNMALPAAPTVSIANASDTVITAPANNDFLVYSSGKWRNTELNINIPAAKYAQAVFSAYGNLPNNNVLLASCTVTVPAGTWLLKAEASGSFYGLNVGGGTNNLWFQGDALSGQSLAHTQIVLYSDQGVDQGYHHTSGRVVTVASTTTFTLDLWVSGGNIYMRGGKLTLMAV